MKRMMKAAALMSDSTAVGAQKKWADAPKVPRVVRGHTFTMTERYTPKKLLGRGSFGVVCTAIDHGEGDRLIAVKRIRPFANDEWDARHTLREVRLLKVLGAHPNIITLYELAVFEEKSELYMMMEVMDCDLHRIIQSKQSLSDAHFKCFAWQLLEGLRAMHEIGVFHRDLKPGNILVSKDCQLRITDFGLARFMDESTLAGDNSLNPMTEYVVTRWYRCPELLLAPTRPYTAAIDLWSVGCILVELLSRTPLFPGKSHTNQVQLIMDIKGYEAGNTSAFGFPLSDEAQSFLSRKCTASPKSLRQLYPKVSPEALEMCEKFIELNPNHRPTAENSLQHPFLTNARSAGPIHSQKEVHLQTPDLSLFDFENSSNTLAQLKEKIREEVFQERESLDRKEQHAETANGRESSMKYKSDPAVDNARATTTASSQALGVSQSEAQNESSAPVSPSRQDSIRGKTDKVKRLMGLQQQQQQEQDQQILQQKLDQQQSKSATTETSDVASMVAAMSVTAAGGNGLTNEKAKATRPESSVIISNPYASGVNTGSSHRPKSEESENAASRTDRRAIPFAGGDGSESLRKESPKQQQMQGMPERGQPQYPNGKRPLHGIMGGLRKAIGFPHLSSQQQRGHAKQRPSSAYELSDYGSGLDERTASVGAPRAPGAAFFLGSIIRADSDRERQFTDSIKLTRQRQRQLQMKSEVIPTVAKRRERSLTMAR
jgi:serine/threonine protein kinase